MSFNKNDTNIFLIGIIIKKSLKCEIFHSYKCKLPKMCRYRLMTKIIKLTTTKLKTINLFSGTKQTFPDKVQKKVVHLEDYC